MRSIRGSNSHPVSSYRTEGDANRRGIIRITSAVANIIDDEREREREREISVVRVRMEHSFSSVL